MAHPPILSIDKVSQTYRVGFLLKKVEVLKQVSFGVPKNSVFGLLGPNGAGKTTLIKLVVGLRSPSGGSIKINGHEATSREARTQIGYMPERPYFHEHLTGRALLTHMGRLSGMSDDAIAKRIPVVLEQVFMSHAADMELKSYSKGMLQRVGIAQAILHDPELLVLDEPMSGLDPMGRKELRELLLGLANVGKTIFFSTHIMEDVESLCKEVAILQKGKLVELGAVSKFMGAGAANTEIAFSGVVESTLQGNAAIGKWEKTAFGYRTLVEKGDGVQKALAEIIQRGGQIHWVNPVRSSLEDFFKRTQ